MKRTIALAAGALALLVASFVAGRFSAPVKTTETATRKDESAWLSSFLASLETQQTATTKKHVETRKTKRPDGTIEIVRVEDSGSQTDTHSTGNAAGQSQGTSSSAATTTKVTETGRPGWAAGLSAAWDPGRLSSMPDRIGLELDRRIVGTVWLGVRASAEPDLGNLRLGLSARMEF